ncbi:MAG: hypothetical protein LBB76_01305, partial [Azoarcus sp.]|nr:hypothetical protein [Azoarcus sp.]
YAYARKRDYEKALEICEWLIQDETTEIGGYRERSAVYSHMGDIKAAIRDQQYVISKGSEEPWDFFHLGLLQLEQSLAAQAADSFGMAVAMGDKAEYYYYRESALFFRAVAYLESGDFERAIQNCAEVAADFETYVRTTTFRGMRSREDILNAAHAALEARAHRGTSVEGEDCSEG